MRGAALFIVTLLAAASVQAQTLTTNPSPPRAGQPFTIQVKLAACYSLTGVAVNGTNVDVTLLAAPACITTPPIITLQITAPPLPAGLYALRLISSADSSVMATAPLAVSADIPALDPYVLAMLAVALVLAGALRLRVR